MATTPWRYRAFISYSQKDKKEARRLHRWLESYRAPSGLQLPLDRSRKLGRFFRDDEEMGAASDIGATVRGAIEDSESLIVMCSPRSAQSKWVNAEIHHFRRTGRANKVFAVIIDGAPNSSKPETECFPPALRAGVDPADPDAMPIEPLGLDLRKEGRPRACARLAAGILGVEFDQLWRRERKRRRARAMQLAGAVAGAFVALMAGIGFYDRATAREALTAHATVLLEQGDRSGALPFALAGLGGARPKAEEVVDDLGGQFPLIANIKTPRQQAEEIQFSPDGHTLAVRTDDEKLTLWDTETGAQLGAPAPSTKFFFLPGRVVVYRDFGAVILDSRTGKLVAQLPTLVEERDGDPIQVAGDTIVAAINYTDFQVGVWDAKDGRLRFTFRSPHHDDGPAFQLSGNGDRLLDCGDSPRCTLWDLRAGKALFENVEAYHPSMSDDGTRVGAVTSHGVSLWDGQGRPGAQIPITGDVASLKFSPDGARVAIATQARGSLWDAARGARLADLGGVDEQLPPDVAGDADLGGAEQGDGEHGDGDIEGEQSDAIIFSSDGSRLLIKGTNDRVWLWDPRAPRLVLATGGAFRTWMSPAGRRLFIQTTKGNFTLLDAITGKTLKTIVPSRETIDEATFFDRAGQILLATNSDAYNDPGRQILWGYDGRKIADLGLRPSIPFVAMTPDGRRIGALLADGAVGLWGGSPTLAALHGENLRSGICRAARNGEPPFTGAERDATPVATYLRGRPWNACDWRGLDDPAGWAQTIRYWAVRAGLAWDYRPKTCSARMWEFGCPARRGA